jgi:hypothetical protein
MRDPRETNELAIGVETVAEGTLHQQTVRGPKRTHVTIPPWPTRSRMSIQLTKGNERQHRYSISIGPRQPPMLGGMIRTLHKAEHCRNRMARPLPGALPLSDHVFRHQRPTSHERPTCPPVAHNWPQPGHTSRLMQVKREKVARPRPHSRSHTQQKPVEFPFSLASWTNARSTTPDSGAQRDTQWHNSLNVDHVRGDREVINRRKLTPDSILPQESAINRYLLRGDLTWMTHEIEGRSATVPTSTR